MGTRRVLAGVAAAALLAGLAQPAAAAPRQVHDGGMPGSGHARVHAGSEDGAEACGSTADRVPGRWTGPVPRPHHIAGTMRAV